MRSETQMERRGEKEDELGRVALGPAPLLLLLFVVYWPGRGRAPTQRQRREETTQIAGGARARRATPMGVKQVLVRRRLHDDDDDQDDDGGSSTGSAAAREEVLLDQSPSPPPMSSCGRYLLHRVCRFDTLAGVAIKYGVEVPARYLFDWMDGWMSNRRNTSAHLLVADVKRANGLTTDLQMFAHKTLRVPLHGRHPPAAAATSPPSSSPDRYRARYPFPNAHHSKYAIFIKKPPIM